MTQQQATPQENWTKKRRSQRLVMSIPVVAYRPLKAGRPFFEGAQTLSVSAHGALITLATAVAADQRLILKHAVSGEEQECRVKFVQKKPNSPTEVGVEFQHPAPDFWRIAFPPNDWKRPQ